MPYLNPGGHNWGPQNFDGYGISYILVAVIYSLFFYAACYYLWINRNHAMLKMRNIPLALMSIMILHFYLVIVLLVYPLNGIFPCGFEFWVMSLYFPIGIGLFQAQNQQLLLVSRAQNRLLAQEGRYKPMIPRAKGIGGPSYWFWRMKLWWLNTSAQGKYQGFVFVGIVIQFVADIVIYCISRNFNSYGIVSHHTSASQCRRGWEWIPSIFWQLLWNYFFGPYLIWKIRLIHDIYHWRLQTILAIIAGLPGTPLWLAATYTNAFTSISKYWVPPMWLVPGLFTMELTTLLFPILQLFKCKKSAKETKQALADFDAKRQNPDTMGNVGSILTNSTGSKSSRKMYTMESLEELLKNNYIPLQAYCSKHEFNSENIIFLAKVIEFKHQWVTVFSKSTDFTRARFAMFRVALNIYLTLVHPDTATYPINVEGPVKIKLDEIFGDAAALVGSIRRGSTTSTHSSVVTPWDEPSQTDPMQLRDYFQMHAIPAHGPSIRNESMENILPYGEKLGTEDPLAGYSISPAFKAPIFDEAYKSIKFMIWSEPYQRFMATQRASVLE